MLPIAGAKCVFSWNTASVQQQQQQSGFILLGGFLFIKKRFLFSRTWYINFHRRHFDISQEGKQLYLINIYTWYVCSGLKNNSLWLWSYEHGRFLKIFNIFRSRCLSKVLLTVWTDSVGRFSAEESYSYVCYVSLSLYEAGRSERLCEGVAAWRGARLPQIERGPETRFFQVPPGSGCSFNAHRCGMITQVTGSVCPCSRDSGAAPLYFWLLQSK